MRIVPLFFWLSVFFFMGPACTFFCYFSVCSLVLRVCFFFHSSHRCGGYVPAHDACGVVEQGRVNWIFLVIDAIVADAPPGGSVAVDRVDAVGRVGTGRGAPHATVASCRPWRPHPGATPPMMERRIRGISRLWSDATPDGVPPRSRGAGPGGRIPFARPHGFLDGSPFRFRVLVW